MRFRPSRFVRDSGLTVAGFLATTIVQAICTGLFARLLSADDFGALSYWRRASALALPIAGLGVHLALARFAAMRPDRLAAYARATALVTVVGLGATGAVAMAAQVGWIPLPSALQPYAVNALPTFAATAGWVLVGAGASGLRGMGRNLAALSVEGLSTMATVSSVVLLKTGFVPKEGPGAVTAILLAMASLSTIAGAIVLLRLARPTASAGERSGPSPLRESLAFSLPRVPAIFLLALLFFLPTVAAGNSTLREVALVAVALTVIRVLDPVTGALSVLLFPRAARAEASGREAEQAEFWQIVLEFTFVVLVLALFLFPGIANPLVAAWFGSAYRLPPGMVQWVALATGPYLAYTIAIAPLQAAASKAWATWLLAAAVLTELCVQWALTAKEGAVAGLVAFAASTLLLASGSLVVVQRQGRARLPLAASLLLVGLAAVAAVVCDAVVDPLFAGRGTLTRLAVSGVARGVAVLGLFGVCVASRMRWALAIRDRLLSAS